MTHPPQLTPLQLSVLRVLWQRGEARVPEVCEGMQGTRRLAKNTVATVLSRLEKQGLVSHRPDGRQFVYRAEVEQQEAQGTMVEELIRRVFEGDDSRLFAHLIDRKGIAPGDLERVKQLIEAREQGLHAKEED